jgi:hypothetical protein
LHKDHAALARYVARRESMVPMTGPRKLAKRGWKYVRRLVPKRTIFATLWEGPLDPLIYSCFASFPHHGARLRVYTYDDELDLPPGVERADARRICADRSLSTQYIADGRPSFAMFSDLFRYRLVRETGCCWVDADILCLRRPDFSAEPIVFGRQFEPSHPWSINTAVLKLPAKHPMLRELVATAEAAIGVDHPWATIGPVLLTELASRYQIDGCAHDIGAFYPLPPPHFWKPLMPEQHEHVRTTVAQSTFLHLWHENFRRSAYDKHACPPARSFLHETFAEIGTLPRFRRAYNPNDLRRRLGDWIQE